MTHAEAADMAVVDMAVAVAVIGVAVDADIMAEAVVIGDGVLMLPASR